MSYFMMYDRSCHVMPRVQPKGQVTLESPHRQEVGIRPGDEVEEVVLRPGDPVPRAGILVMPKRLGFARWRGYLGKPGRNRGDVDAIMRELRGEPNP